MYTSDHINVFIPPHRELRYQVKIALNSGVRHDPAVRIEMPYDSCIFSGGLQQAGHFIRTYRGHNVYGIERYADLTPLLGERWHIRGLNSKDFCYVNAETVQFHLHKREPLQDFQLDASPFTEPTGHTLVFKFVRMDGVYRQWKDILAMP